MKGQIWIKGEWVLSGDNSRSKMEYTKQKDYSEENHGHMINTLKEIILKRDSERIHETKPIKDEPAQIEMSQGVHFQPEDVQIEDVEVKNDEVENANPEHTEIENTLKEQNESVTDVKADQDPLIQAENIDQVMNEEKSNEEQVNKVEKEFLIEKDFSK